MFLFKRIKAFFLCFTKVGRTSILNNTNVPENVDGDIKFSNLKVLADSVDQEQFNPFGAAIIYSQGVVCGPETYSHHQDRHKSAFIHTKNRMKERYGIDLNHDTWRAWNRSILRNDSHALHLEEKDLSSTWRVWHGSKIVFVAFKKDCVVTCLQSSPRLQSLVNGALRERSRNFPSQISNPRQHSYPSGQKDNSHSLLKKNQPVRLPPKHKRPKRNEEALLALKEKALGVKSFYDEDYQECYTPK